MNYSELEKAIERCDRLRKRLQDKGGIGTGWPFQTRNGETHSIRISGVKPPEEIEDDIASMFIWLWNLKDYVKKFSVTKGKSGKWVEAKVNHDPYLCICADIANSLKHGGLDKKYKSRSGKEPKLGKLKHEAPQASISTICFTENSVHLHISDPSKIKLEMPVVGGNDHFLGDAFKYLEYSLNAWERIIQEVDRAV